MVSKFSGRRRSRGQGMVEYALLVALVAMVVIVGLVAIAPRLNTIFQQVGPALQPVATMTTSPATPAPTATTSNGKGCGNNGSGNGGVGNCH